MGFYSLDLDYGPAAWLEAQGAYDLHIGADLMLDLSRKILESDAYICQCVAFPKGDDVHIAPGATFSGTLNLPPFAYVVAMTAWSANGNQFTVRISDKGAQTDLYAGQFAWYPTVVSNMTGTPNEGAFIVQNDQNKPFGPYFFRDPLLILPPGALQIQVSNVGLTPLVAQFGIIQILFMLAVPKNTTSMINQKVETPSDQTGIQSLVTTALNLVTS